MKNKLPQPFKKAMIFEDKKIYACLANYPIAEGHTVIVWKKKVTDLHLLQKKDYEYLMDRVDEIRNAMLRTLKIKKVYLIYMDEANQVHWHLVPRYNIKGYDVLMHKPSKLKNFTLVSKIRDNIVLKI